MTRKKRNREKQREEEKLQCSPFKFFFVSAATELEIWVAGFSNVVVVTSSPLFVKKTERDFFLIEQKLLKRNHFCCRNKSHGENPTWRSFLSETDPGLEVRRSQQDVAVVDQLDVDAERQRRRRRRCRRSTPDHSADASSCHRHFADRQLEICPGTIHFSHLRVWSKVFNWI